MPWLKKHYDRVLLICSALLLIAVSALFFLNSQNFAESNNYAPTLAIVKNTAPRNDKIQPAPLEEVTRVSALVSAPAQWTTAEPRLFVSAAIALRDGILSRIDKGKLHPPVPNPWINQYNLQINDAELLTRDSDGDGFNTLEEWIGIDPTVPTSVEDRKSTNPTDAKSHPPYLTKLFLEKIDKPKLLITYEGSPFPGSYTFNTGAGTSSQILEIGSIITEERPGEAPRKRFKLEKFDKKEIPNPTMPEIMKDVSEITLFNEETKTRHIIKTGETMDSPDSYAVFDYAWDGTKFTVKQGTEFQLKPDGAQYKLIDIKDDKAVIQDKSGTSLEIRKRSPQS